MNHHRPSDRRGEGRDPRATSSREAPTKKAVLNEYWIDGDGINREVLQGDICKYLGAEATSRPGDYNGRKGFKIKALRPFTPEMLEDIRAASRDYGIENRALKERYREEVPYEESETRRRQDPQTYPSGHSSGHGGYPNSSAAGGFPPIGSPYSAEPSAYMPPAGYPSGSGYPPGSGYPSAAYNSMAPGSSSVPAYAGNDPRNDPRYPQSHYTYAQPPRDDPRYQQQYYAPSSSGYGAEPPRQRDPRDQLQAGYQYRNTGPGDEMPREYYEAQMGGRGIPPGGPSGYGDPHRGQPQYDDPSQDPYRGNRQPDPYNGRTQRR